jgi:hypothetical protein
VPNKSKGLGDLTTQTKVREEWGRNQREFGQCVLFAKIAMAFPLHFPVAMEDTKRKQQIKGRRGAVISAADADADAARESSSLLICHKSKENDHGHPSHRSDPIPSHHRRSIQCM